MKKSLIALAALTTIAGSVAAQSSVTVYGVVDLGYGAKDYSNTNYTTNLNGNVTGAQQGALSSQRLGFKGTEDLGSGLKANFVLETGMAINTATAFARTYTVGLSDTKLGSLDIGHAKTVSQLMMERYTAGGANNWVGEFFNYADATTFNATATADTTQADTNIIADYTAARATGFHYNSPVISGFQVGATYANSDSKDQDGTVSNNAKSENRELAVVYTGIQGLSLGASKGEKRDRAATTASAETKATVTQFGGSYTMGAATLYAQYIESQKLDTVGVQSNKMEGTQYGVKYAVTPRVTVHAQMGKADEETTTAGTKVYDRKGYQLGAQYALSNRTTAYVLYGQQESKKVSDGKTDEIKGTVAGIRHSF